jgi:hypothetical protein
LSPGDSAFDGARQAWATAKAKAAHRRAEDRLLNEEIKAKAKAKAKTKAKAPQEKLLKQVKEDTVSTALPTVSLSVSELDELSQQMEQELEEFDRSYVIYERASSMRVRDYINHIESQIQKESWSVVTKMDTSMLKQWPKDVSAYQIALNNDETTN